MYLRIDRLQIDMPVAENPDPKAANAVQELMGGRFGEMSTLMNYTYQSFNFRGKDKAKPFYDLIANIATEELGHIELVGATVSGLLTGSVPRESAENAPLRDVLGVGNPHHFINGGMGVLAGDSAGAAWRGDYVFNSGDLVLDLLHNFFLECGARMGKLRVYEMTDNPIARRMLGYLLVRGGVHQLAYAKALEELTGVEVQKMLNIPNVSNTKFPETKDFMDNQGHATLYRFSPNDYRDIDKIWKGSHPEDGATLQVVDGPPEGGPVIAGEPEPAVFAPGYDPGEVEEIAKRLMKG
jgi:Mn-containing catalase